MAVKLGDAFVRVRPDTSTFQREAEGPIKGTMGRVSGVIAGSLKLVGAASGVAGGLTVASLVKTGAAYNDLEQKSKAAFTTILGSSEAAADMMGKIREFGRTSPFPRQAFIQATQQLLGFGFEADAIIPTLATINDTVAAIGGGAPEIAQITDIFAKIKGQGRITGEELNRLGSVGINALDMLAKHAGVSSEEMRKQISKGAVDSDLALKVLTEGMQERFAGASENVKATWSGATDRVKGAWRDLGSALMEPFISTGGGGYAVQWANDFADLLRKVEGRVPGIVTGLESVWAILSRGEFTGSEATFGWAEDAKVVDWLFRVHEGLVAAGDAYESFKAGLSQRGPLDGFSGWANTAGLGVAAFLAALEDGDVTSDGFVGAMERAGSMVRTVDLGVRALWAAFQEGDVTSDGFVGVMERIGVALKDVKDWIAGLDWASLKQGFQDVIGDGDAAADAVSSLWDSAQKLVPVVVEFIDKMPGLSEVLQVGATVMEFLADNADTLTAAIPFLITGLIALKVAQAAANVAAAASIPLRWAEVASRTQLTRSNTALVASMNAHTATIAANTGTTVANTAATNTGLLTRIRTTAATVAGAAAERAAAAARGIATAAQWALNAAMTANPIGIVIMLIAALVAGIVIAYKNSETFRNIVDTAFRKIAEAGKWMWENVLKPAFTMFVEAILNVRTKMSELKTNLDTVWEGLKALWREGNRFLIEGFLDMVGKVLDGAVKMFGWVPGVGDKLREAKSSFDTFRDDVNRALGGIDDKSVSVEVSLGPGATKMARWSDLPVAKGALIDYHAAGDIRENHVAQIARGGAWRVWAEDETGGESYIPLSPAKRMRSRQVWRETGKRLGIDWDEHASGAIRAKTADTTALAAGIRRMDRETGRYARHIADKVEQALVAKAEGSTRMAGAIRGNGTGSQASLMAFARQMIAMGARVTEHSRYGGVGRHTRGSKHYQDRAVDVNYGPGGESSIEKAFFDRVVRAGIPQSYGLRVLWRVPQHFNHLHADYDRGGLAVGRGVMLKRTLRPERTLSPEQTKAFERLVDYLERGGTAQPLIGEYHHHATAGDGSGDVDELLHALRVLRRGGVYT